MIWQDLPEVIALTKQTPETPWTEQDLRSRLGQRNTIGIIAERNDTIEAFAVYELHPNRLHINNLIVSDRSRRQGIGKLIIDKLKNKLDPERKNRITLNVSESNLVAQQFLRAMGFRAVQIIRKPYDDREEDAYCMRYGISSEVASIIGD
jgi:ribosomal-protein-alanine N-acetyltransferase